MAGKPAGYYPECRFIRCDILATGHHKPGDDNFPIGSISDSFDTFEEAGLRVENVNDPHKMGKSRESMDIGSRP